MAQIIPLEKHRHGKAAISAFCEWRAFVPPSVELNEHTTWSCLPDELILTLCEDLEEGRYLIFQLVLGFLGEAGFRDERQLPSNRILRLLDLYFLILEGARFECMRRIGWVEPSPLSNTPILAPLLLCHGRASRGLLKSPRLTRLHPGYTEDNRGLGIDRKAVSRRNIQESIQVLRRKRLSEEKAPWKSI